MAKIQAGERVFYLDGANPALVDVFLELSMIDSLIPYTPNVVGGNYMISITQQEVDQIKQALEKASGAKQ